LILAKVRSVALLALALSVTASHRPKVHIHYGVGIDPDDPSSIEVSMQIDGPRSVRVAMAVHPEYNDRFWRYITDWQVNGYDKKALLQVDRENVWRVISHAGHAQISYRIRLPAENPTNRAVWHTGLRTDGGSINPIDTFLYLPDFPDAEVSLTVHLPGSIRWDVPILGRGYAMMAIVVLPGEPPPRIRRPVPMSEAQTNTSTLLDSPILYGDSLRTWTFAIEGIPHSITYWPLPNATLFDTTRFVDGIQKVAREAVAVFGKPAYPNYQFLLEDGAWGALEHKNSVTIGMPSRDLAHDPHMYLPELAHEFFHAWNLMRLYPEGRGVLSADPPARSTGLWFSEGVTMYYAEALTRRAGFPERNMSRADLLAEEIESYYQTPGNTRISPEEASARAVDTTGRSGDYEANYYNQGRLIGTMLDLLIKDFSNGRNNLDDLMRDLYANFAMKRGFTTTDVERATSRVCFCVVNRFFADHVRNPHPLDFNRYLATIGLRAIVDTIPAVDSAGAPLPDTRVWAYPRRSDGRMRVWIHDPASVWARAGLHTGQDLVAFNGTPIDSFPDFRRAFRTIRMGQVVPVDIVQNGARQITVTVSGYNRVRVRIVPIPDATPSQKERLHVWEQGR
jgi:predicted metalloprotease with PDZ domain